MIKKKTAEDEGIAREEEARARWAVIGCRPKAYNVASGIIDPARPGNLQKAPRAALALLKRSMAAKGARWQDWMIQEPIMAFRRYIAPDELADSWALAVAPDPRNAPTAAAWAATSPNGEQRLAYASKKRDVNAINGFGYRVRMFAYDGEFKIWRDVSAHDARRDRLDGRKLDEIARSFAREGERVVRVDPNLVYKAVDRMPGEARKLTAREIADNSFDGYNRTTAQARTRSAREAQKHGRRTA